MQHPSTDNKPLEASVLVQIHSADITGESKGKEGSHFNPSKPDDCPASPPKYHSNRDTNALPTLKWKMGPLLTPNAPDTKSSGVGLARHA